MARSAMTCCFCSHETSKSTEGAKIGMFIRYSSKKDMTLLVYGT